MLVASSCLRLLHLGQKPPGLPLGAQSNLAGAAPVSDLSGAQAPGQAVRALVLARELRTRGVQAIKADQWDTPPPA